MPYTSPDTAVVLFPPALYTFPTAAPTLMLGSAGVRFFLNVATLVGGQNLFVVIGEIDPFSGNEIQLAKWQFPMITSPGLHELTIYPGITEQANQAVNDCIHGDLIASIFPGGNTPGIKLSLCAVPIW